MLWVTKSVLKHMLLLLANSSANIYNGGSDKPACSVEDLSSIPGLGRAPGGGHGHPPQFSCLENPHVQRRLKGYNPCGLKE